MKDIQENTLFHKKITFYYLNETNKFITLNALLKYIFIFSSGVQAAYGRRRQHPCEAHLQVQRVREDDRRGQCSQCGGHETTQSSSRTGKTNQS